MRKRRVQGATPVSTSTARNATDVEQLVAHRAITRSLGSCQIRVPSCRSGAYCFQGRIEFQLSRYIPDPVKLSRGRTGRQEEGENQRYLTVWNFVPHAINEPLLVPGSKSKSRKFASSSTLRPNT